MERGGGEMVSFTKIGRRWRDDRGGGWGFDCIANISSDCDHRHKNGWSLMLWGRGEEGKTACKYSHAMPR